MNANPRTSDQTHEYICPGCGTLRQVDMYCSELGGEEEPWDIKIGVWGISG